MWNITKEKYQGSNRAYLGVIPVGALQDLAFKANSLLLSEVLEILESLIRVLFILGRGLHSLVKALTLGTVEKEWVSLKLDF